MYVPLRASDRSLRNLQNLGKLGCIQIARRAHLDPGISALGNQGRKPANFQLQPDHHQQVGLTQFEQKAGLGLDKVRVLVTLGD